MNGPTQIIYDVFDKFKQYIAQQVSFEKWEEYLFSQWNALKECKDTDTDYVLTECILRMFIRGSIEIEHKRQEWKEAEITVKFGDKEYKTSMPIYNLGVFKNTPVSDTYLRTVVYNRLAETCNKAYDKFLPEVI